jgi:hypothetical protein
VMAQGGFPYVISTPGSYKLSGPLTMTTTPTGNYTGFDLAIGIASSRVNLDLNGFSIIVLNNDAAIAHNYFAIVELGTFSQISVTNGNIEVKSVDVTVPFGTPRGVYLHTSTLSRVADMSILIESFSLILNTAYGSVLDVGPYSLVLRNRVKGGDPGASALIACPSVIVENVSMSPTPVVPCAKENNAHCSNIFGNQWVNASLLSRKLNYSTRNRIQVTR